MKSVKPGRGPSMMGGIACIGVAIFGILWTFGAASIGAGPFALFGLVFVGIAIANAIYSFKNATSENRYSEFDIVDEHEEPDPLNVRYGAQHDQSDVQPRESDSFCPYCGEPAAADFRFCAKCGKQLP